MDLRAGARDDAMHARRRAALLLLLEPLKPHWPCTASALGALWLPPDDPLKSKGSMLALDPLNDFDRHVPAARGDRASVSVDGARSLGHGAPARVSAQPHFAPVLLKAGMARPSVSPA